MNNCYMLEISTNALLPKESMNELRAGHGLQKMAQKIFAFGGSASASDQVIKSAEVYDVVQNKWKNLPNMPKGGSLIT